MNQKSCPFCSNEVQSNAFATSSDCLALLNHSPILPGHLLIIPRQHIESLYELSEPQIGDFFSFARAVTEFITTYYDAEAYDWSLQEGEAAGQSVSHLHLHIIPRTAGDLPEGEEWYSKLQESKAIDDPMRKIMGQDEFERKSAELRSAWNTYQAGH